MATTCALCEKGSQMGGGYSNRTRATKFNPVGKRRRKPNLHWTKMPGGERLRICTRCIKKGAYLAKA